MAKYNTVTWEDRFSEFPTKRKLTVVSTTGTTGIETGNTITATVERDEGTVTTVGTAFNQTNMNGFETRVQNIFGVVRSATQLYITDVLSGDPNPKYLGTTSDFYLNDDYDKYDYLGIYYCAAGGSLSGYTEINTNDPKDITECVCSLSYPTGSYNMWYLRSAYIKIAPGSNKKLVHFERNGSISLTPGSAIPAISRNADSLIGVVRVVGYTINVLTPAQQETDHIRQGR